MRTYKYKLIVASIRGEGFLALQDVKKLYYFNSQQEAKDFLLQRKGALECTGRRIWFYRVWEFEKEDYQDLENDFFKLNL